MLRQETKEFNMSKNKKPIFTPEELNLVKTSLDIGYEPNALLPGYDFKKKHFQRKIPNLFMDIKEKLDGTAKKREYHKEINQFGWAYIQQNKLMFGVKFSSHGFNKIKDLEKSVIHKYKQLLKYYLEKAGWQKHNREKKKPQPGQFPGPAAQTAHL